MKTKTLKAWAVIDNKGNIVVVIHKGVENFNVCLSKANADKCIFNHDTENQVIPCKIIFNLKRK